MATLQITRSFKGPDGVVYGEPMEEVTSDGLKSYDISLSGAQTDAAVAFTCDQSHVKAICMVSTAAVTIETNSSSAPDDTISLLANKPLLWSLANDGLGRCPFSGDVTGLFLTSAGTFALTIRVIEDITT
jgi:hypothetical protein